MGLVVADGQVVAHMMPDLPNVGLERDINGFVVRRLCCAAVPLSLGRIVSVNIFHCSSSLSLRAPPLALVNLRTIAYHSSDRSSLRIQPSAPMA